MDPEARRQLYQDLWRDRQEKENELTLNKYIQLTKTHTDT